MSRAKVAAASGAGFIFGGFLGGAIGGQLANEKQIVGPPTAHEIERMSIGAGIGAFIGSVSFAAAFCGDDTSQTSASGVGHLSSHGGFFFP